MVLGKDGRLESRFCCINNLKCFPTSHYKYKVKISRSFADPDHPSYFHTVYCEDNFIQTEPVVKGPILHLGKRSVRKEQVLNFSSEARETHKFEILSYHVR